MIILPAVDLYGGKVVRLKKGDYSKMTVFGNDPAAFAEKFENEGAKWLHVVDLEGARDGGTPNFSSVKQIISKTSLSVEVGGGIRDLETIEEYLDAGVSRVILGTAALEDRAFLAEAAEKHGSHIAVGADLIDGRVAVRGWLSVSETSGEDFLSEIDSMGIKTVICTDISKDGLLSGTNLPLYRELSGKYGFDIIASGGITTLDDVSALASMNLYGAILGRALYDGNIRLGAAIGVTV